MTGTYSVNIKKLRKDAIVPMKGSAGAAGFDLYACGEEEGRTILPEAMWKVPTGIAVEIPGGCFGAIFARSGIATKNGLRPANCVGVIDSDYRGEVIVALYNDSKEPQYVSNGDRIAQLVILPYIPAFFNVVDELNETERGEGGFGSTGKTSMDSEYEQISLLDCME